MLLLNAKAMKLVASLLGMSPSKERKACAPPKDNGQSHQEGNKRSNSRQIFNLEPSASTSDCLGGCTYKQIVICILVLINIEFTNLGSITLAIWHLKLALHSKSFCNTWHCHCPTKVQGKYDISSNLAYKEIQRWLEVTVACTSGLGTLNDVPMKAV